MGSRETIIIGVAGGTGSGKTTVAANLKDKLKTRLSVNIIQQDNYYHDRGNIPEAERKLINYDHPNAIDFDLLNNHLHFLKDKQSVNIPDYDFKTHTRRISMLRMEPADVIIVEGILIYFHKEIREMLSYKVFLDVPDDVRFIRRLQRDIHERGRDVQSVINQYLDLIRPMHKEFVEPTKRYADIVISLGDIDNGAINRITSSVLKDLHND